MYEIDKSVSSVHQLPHWHGLEVGGEQRQNIEPSGVVRCAIYTIYVAKLPGNFVLGANYVLCEPFLWYIIEVLAAVDVPSVIFEGKMDIWRNAFPSLGEFLPPTPRAFHVTSTMFKWMPLIFPLLWTPLRHYQAMGKTSSKDSRLNFPGRYAWAIGESVGPLNLLYILYTLPQRLHPRPDSATSLFGTGLPLQNEIMGLLYVVHYANRAIITPLFLAPSMSPIHLSVSLSMATFQYFNSTNLASWISYSSLQNTNPDSTASIFTLPAIIGISLYIAGLAGNILAEQTLFDLRRGAAKRKAKSEGKATVTYDKVYVIPPATGLFKYILFPHYTLEWLEWTGYYILGGAFGLGHGWTNSAALWFLVSELGTMMPRAWSGVEWYTNKFGARAVAGRSGSVPGII